MGQSDEYKTDLWIVRHGETEWSKSGQHTSRTDLPLTPEGERAAVALRPVLEGVHFDLVLSSPRQRARRTAELIGMDDVVIWDDLVEWDYGDYEGRTRAAIQEERPEWSVWVEGCPGGESPEQVSQRVDEVIERCREVEGVVLMFAHGHILRSLAARWLDHPIALGANLELATTRISILSHDRGAPTLELWNAREPS
jgi:broad specificity phosphatase PhoE